MPGEPIVHIRQFFDPASCSFTYLVARRMGGESVLIDPVLARVPDYLAVIDRWKCRIVRTFDTHFHADHLSGVGRVRLLTRCAALVSRESRATGACDRFADGDHIRVDGMVLEAIHTPGHTPDSYCFRICDRLFTGDTLLIGGTGRTDLPGGDAAAQYESLHRRILTLPGWTQILPGHDYRRRTRSTIAAELRSNPRLQAKGREEYVAIMASLDLPRPRQFEAATAANLHLGILPEKTAVLGTSLLST